MKAMPWRIALGTCAFNLLGACAAESNAREGYDTAGGFGSGAGTGLASGGQNFSGTSGKLGASGSTSLGGEMGSGTSGAADNGGSGKPGSNTAGATGIAGSSTAGSNTGGTSGVATGDCCPDGDCLCHGPDPTELTSGDGPFDTTTFTISTGTVHYPTNAEPPFAGVAICGGFTNTGPEMAPWAPFYASHGIVTVVVTTGALDDPALRATKLLAAVEELKGENTKSGSPLMGKLGDRFGTSGYSMGGGGTTIASGDTPSLKTSVGLAPWAPDGTGVQVPTLLLCGSSDTVAPCSMAEGAYSAIPSSTPKVMIAISGSTHFDWFAPTDAGNGTSGKYALAFQKVYLEGDQRWKPFLLEMPSTGTVTKNVQ